MPTYQGSGGAIFEVTPPELGSAARENFDAAIAKGELVEVEAPKQDAKPAPKPAKKKAPARKAAASAVEQEPTTEPED